MTTTQIQSNLSDLKSEHSRLLTVWEAKKTKIDQRLEYHSLLQEVDSLEATCAAHEVCVYEVTKSKMKGCYVFSPGQATDW